MSNVNTRGGYFPHFGTVGSNPIGGFGAFRNNNNNNPSPPSSPLPPLPLPEENARGLDPNVAVLVNALTGANLGVNHVDRESNHVKPIEFGGTEAEDPNE